MQDVRDYSDGYTEAWFMPDAKNIPAEISKVCVKQPGCVQLQLRIHTSDWRNVQPPILTVRHAQCACPSE